MPDEAYPMVGECTDLYEAVRQADGGVSIHISVPPRFADLWLMKLTQLTTTDAEIAEYEPEAAGPGA
jgi:hypothetical protein